MFAASSENEREISVNTDYAKFRIHGEYSFAQLPDNLYQVMHLLAPDYFDKEMTLPHKQNFSFKLEVMKAAIFNELFFPNLDANDFYVNGNFNGESNSLNLAVKAGYMRYNEWDISKTTLNTKVENGKKATLSGGIVQVKDRDTVLLSGMSLRGMLADNRSSLALSVADTAAIVAAGKILTDIQFAKEQIKLTFDTSYMAYRGVKFDFSRGGKIAYQNNAATVDSVAITSPQENVSVNGYYNFNNDYNIKADIKQLNLNLINLFDPKQSIAYNGNANGTFAVKGKGGQSNVDAQLRINNLVLDNDTIGNLTISSEYNDVQKRMSVLAKTLSGKLKSLEASGYIDMRSSPYALHLNVAFAESDLKSFQAFLKEQIHITTGTVQAKCSIDGTLNNLKVNGKINVSNVVARIEYLKTIYRFSSGIVFNGSDIEIPAFDLFDVNNRKAVVSGKISHNSFSDFSYRIRIGELQKFQLLNTTANDNDLYYGTAYISGNVSFIGPQKALLMEGNIKTEKGTVFNIPLSESASDGSGIITFVNRDTNVVTSKIIKQEKLFGFEMNTILNITPDAEINIVFDESKGDKISGTGEGLLKMEMTKQGLFNMYGEVKINKGEYKFTALDFFVKKFILKSGSTIVWSGDPLQARMNITGSYTVRRTSVANILVGLSAGQIVEARKQRIPAECLMYINGSLQSPQYKFDLSFPGVQGMLSASTITTLENSLNRLRAEPQQMEQQVINLILFGNFLPMEGNQQFAGNTSLSSGLNGTLSDIVSSQASNLFDKVIPGLDVNVDYSRGTDQQDRQLIFSASKKLLNDRLEVQGSFGNTNNGANSGNNNSFMTQYDLNKSGNLKLRAYSRSVTDPIGTIPGATPGATAGSIYNRQINTQGLGLFFRKEFDTFFKKKKEEPKDTTSVGVNKN